MKEVLLVLEVISHIILRLNMWLVVLRPALKPACSTVIDLSLFIMIFSITLLIWLTKLIVW